MPSEINCSRKHNMSINKRVAGAFCAVASIGWYNMPLSQEMETLPRLLLSAGLPPTIALTIIGSGYAAVEIAKCLEGSEASEDKDRFLAFYAGMSVAFLGVMGCGFPQVLEFMEENLIKDKQAQVLIQEAAQDDIQISTANGQTYSYDAEKNILFAPAVG